jgi:FkbM family methyltransferase
MLTYAQNFEDVMLDRLFGEQSLGFYIDIGAWHPTELSVTKHFYDLGWSGINVEPIRKQYELFVAERPRDLNLCLAVADRKGPLRFHECTSDTALSTVDDALAAALAKRGHEITSYDIDAVTPSEIFAYCDGKTIDFLKIDAEGCEERIIRSVDWQSFRPRVLVIEAAVRLDQSLDWDHVEALRNWDAWEPLLLASGYVFAWYDGLNRFYLRHEDAHLVPRLSIPPGVYDQLQIPEVQRFARENAEIRRENAEIRRENAEIRRENVEIRHDRERRDQDIRNFIAEIGVERRANEDTIAALRRELERKTESIEELVAVLKTASPDIGETTNETVARLLARQEPVRGRTPVSVWARQIIRMIIGYRLGQFVMHAPKPISIPPRYRQPQGATGTLSISIITPVNNQVQFIAATLESVLSQNYPALEYIVMDGGSVDGSAEIIERYRPSPTRFESGPDTGQANAINKGMEHATGDILGWLNGDDLLLPGAIEYVAHFFETHPQVDVVYGHRIVIDAEGNEIGRWILPPHDNAVLSWADYVPQETMFWRRRIWERVGARIDESFQFALDWDLLVRFRNAGARFARLPRFLGAFRVHRDQKTTKKLGTMGAAEMDRIRVRCLGYLPSYVEINRKIAPYLLKHVVLHNVSKLYKMY